MRCSARSSRFSRLSFTRITVASGNRKAMPQQSPVTVYRNCLSALARQGQQRSNGLGVLALDVRPLLEKYIQQGQVLHCLVQDWIRVFLVRADADQVF